MLIQLQKKNGCTIEFECDLSDADARQIVLEAHRAHQNVGDFALKLATQQRGLSPSQSGWLRYLAMEISGRLRPQILNGPWAWLLSSDRYEAEQIRITPPPVDPDQVQNASAVCRWVFVKRRPSQNVFAASIGSHAGSERLWEYVGLIDGHGGFWFSKHLTQLISGEGRQTMLLAFPAEEEQLRDEAKWLQWQTIQLMEPLKRHP
jgi:hypothetical protein